MSNPTNRPPASNNRGRLIFVVGAAIALFALVHAGRLPREAIPIGLAALIGIRVSSGLMRKARATSGAGRVLAYSGGCLGLVASIICFMVLAGLFVRQMNPMWQQQDRAFRVQKALQVNTMPDRPATNFTSNLPIMVLETDGRGVSRGGQTVARAKIFGVANGRASDSATPEYEGLITMHPRGYTSRHLPKQSYTMHTVDEKNNQTKVSLLGLPKEEDWVLYASFEDKTLMRDVLAFQLTARMGRYAPRTRYVELFIKHSGGPLSMRDYEGVYVLMEKIKRSEERVNIAKLEPRHRSEPEITGGYIVKRDHGDGGESRFHTEHGGPYFYVYPNDRTITAEQKSWLSRYFNSFESALYGPGFRNPQTGYGAYLDVDSFIDAHWLIELGKNVDGFRYSTFLTKDRDGKLKPEPPWDWNRSFGNANYYDGWKVNGWYTSNLRHNEISWYNRLRQDPEFARRCAARWLELRKSVFDPRNINASIDELAAQLREAQERNFKRWPVLGVPITCNYYVGDSFQDEVNWLKNWIKDRVEWIDGQVGLPANL